MISIKGLSKTYINSRKSKVTALNGVNLELPDAGFILVTGESGSGKSTLLNILAGFDTLTSGSFIVNGVDFSKFKQKDLDEWRGRDVAFVFQEYNLISDYTVAENIKIGKNFQGEECTDAQIAKVLKDVKLQGKEDRMLKDLSGGEKQRVAIARALIRQPKVLFADEPSGNIDKINAKKILAILKRISKDVLVICVSHDFELVKKYADKHIKLNKGKITVNRSLAKKKKTKKVAAKPVKKKPVKVVAVEKKPKHKIKQLLNIGVNNITGKKGKAFSLVLLCSAALLFFSVFYMLSGYNSYLALAKNTLHENPVYAVFSGAGVSANKYQQIEDDFDDFNFYKYSGVNWQNEVFGLVEVMAPKNNAEGQKNAFGQEILHGEYPVLTELNGFDIVITDYLAKRIISGQLPIWDEGGTELKSASTFEGIIGKTISTEENIFLKVCGIVKTDFERYTMAEPGSVDYDTYQHNMNTVYTTVHVAPGFINYFASFTGLQDAEAKQVEIKDVNSYSATLASPSYIGTQTVLIPGTSAEYTEALQEGEVIVSYEVYTEFKSALGTSNLNICININNSEFNTYKIVGVLQTVSTEAVIVFSDTDFDEQNIIKLAVFPTTKILTRPGSASADRFAQLIKSLEKKYDMTFESGASSFISEFTDKMMLLKSTLVVFGVLSLAFASVLLYEFISRTINEKRRNIGIIRSLGATSKDVAMILFTTVAIIFVACFALSAIFTTIAGFMINAFVMASTDISFNIANLSWDLYLILLGSNLAVATLASAIPIIRYSHQPPAKQLKAFS